MRIVVLRSCALDRSALVYMVRAVPGKTTTHGPIERRHAPSGLALCRRRAHLRDGAGRRRDAADRVGLSIVEWKPVTGTLPPLSEAAWQAEFDKYKTIPQFQHLNSAMTLAEFKTIFWWEWTHRLMGRVIGAAFLLPFLLFLAKGWVGRAALAAVDDLRARRAAGRGRLVDGGVGLASASTSRNTGLRPISSSPA
jgi:hypothetical protein